MQKKYLIGTLFLFVLFVLFSFPSLAIIPEDFNRNGCFDFEDLMIFAMNYGQCEMIITRDHFH